MAGKKLLGIEFAPLRVPLEQRLQIISAAYMMFTIVFGCVGSCCLTIYFLFYGNLWIKIFMTAYLIHIYYNKDSCFKGRWSKRVYNGFRNMSVWRHSCNYYPIKIIKTTELDPSQNYIFCSVPHGMVGTGVTNAFGTNGADCDKLFPGFDTHLATLDHFFMTPFFREYLFYFGARSCDARSLEYLLSTKSKDGRGRIMLLAIGGTAEAFKSRPGNYEILLKKRKGFVKVALKAGASLVPVLSFGETDLFDQVNNPKGSWLRAFQEFCKKYTGMAPIIPIGRGFFQYSFGLIPRRKPIFIVVGAPIKLPKVGNPTKEDVNKYHEIFTDRLIDLFETHKSRYIENYENVSLILADD